MNKLFTWIIGILGILFIIGAIVYWTHPAGMLPTFMPGYSAGSATVHFKHGLASLILGVGAFILIWFQTGKKKGSSLR